MCLRGVPLTMRISFLGSMFVCPEGDLSPDQEKKKEERACLRVCVCTCVCVRVRNVIDSLVSDGVVSSSSK